MINKTYKLNDFFPQLKASDFEATLTAYCPDNSPEICGDLKRPSIVICPGGGYCVTSDREAEPIALYFLGLGYNSFVLRYSVAPVIYPQALLELAASVALIRRNAVELNADTDKIIVCGFSAGAHLACCLGAFWKEAFISEKLKLSQDEDRPDAMILGYPVITSGKYAHRGSFESLLGKDAPRELWEKLSLENSVNKDTPPAFIWNTYSDGIVPVKNTLLLANALEENGIPFELHIFPKGVHGLSMCDERSGNSGALVDPHCGSWLKLCSQWLKIVLKYALQY